MSQDGPAPIWRQLLVPFFIATLLSLHGYRKKSLRLSGAIMAFVVGLIAFWVPEARSAVAETKNLGAIFHSFLTGDKGAGGEIVKGTRVFGWGMIWFYLSGSRVTKVGKALKATLEEPAHPSGAGYRTAAQVLQNTLSALAASSIYNYLVFNGESLSPTSGLGRKLVVCALGHYSCCLGDTFASELGILSRDWDGPWLVTSFKRVPRGTNGAISLFGTLMSGVGGASVGLVFCVAMWSFEPSFVALGALGGLGGSFVDSVLGATIQETRVNERGLISETGEGKHINGLNLVSNGTVNLLSGVIVASMFTVTF